MTSHSGRATLGGEQFTFTVVWRKDRRRAVRLFDDDADRLTAPYSRPVTPAAGAPMERAAS
jgi:hypothetical protein